MFNLPEVTELKKALPKAQIYRKFELTNAQAAKFDADISRIDIVKRSKYQNNSCNSGRTESKKFLSFERYS